MGFNDWTNLIQSAAIVYLAWQQNQIFKQQNRIFAAQGAQVSMLSETSKLLWLKRYWPTLIMLVLLLLTAFDIYDRHYGGITSAEWRKQAQFLEPIIHENFANQQVELDGKRIENSTFVGTTLVYRGRAPAILANNHLSSPLFVKVVDGPQAIGVSFISLILDRCQDHQDKCDVRGLHIDIVDENLKPLKTP